ncbi:MAG: DNA mismatch repair protein MutS [Alphaproteobacteria bacterium]|nr:DNA mismatch repair protein MutS [Alphaproteobacteria bacterium]
MMEQYLAIKRQYPETLLFYRMGDFYEMFFEDAIEAAGILDIVLTQRGKHSEKPIPMCGVPVHNAEMYLRRLIASGRQVTICEQIESPEEAKQRGGSKALVKRRAVRMVTAGTLLEDELLDADRANRLACFASIRDDWALAWLELASGVFHTQSVNAENLATLFAEIEPNEVLIEDTLPHDVRALIKRALSHESTQISALPRSNFQQTRCADLLSSALEGVRYTALLEVETVAAGVVVGYVQRTQIGKLPKISPPKSRISSKNLIIDAATRRNLELARTLKGEKKGALLGHLDRCVTASGKRLFASMLLSPLAERITIEERLDRVSALCEQREARETLRQELHNLSDIYRSLSRLQLGHDTPKDLKAIQVALQKISKIQRIIQNSTLKAPIKEPWSSLFLPDTLMTTLERALAEEMPRKLADGGVVQAKYDDTLDHHRGLRDDARRLMMGLQMQLQKETGVQNLKIKFNNMLGYFVEVPDRVADKLNAKVFIHRQSIKSATRFTTTELIDLARDIHQAAADAQAREEKLYVELVKEILKHHGVLKVIADLTAKLDVAASLAQLAVEEQYIRPNLYDDTRFRIVAGRHPVVEKSLSGESFMANNCTLEEVQRLWLLSGPNMAGKSTFLRQNALIVIMAQMGSFVPATEADIGIVDQLFSRVGAADDLARGHSTFMVEMIECAAILKRATARSFVILDEIGRGTATYDGLSIAWACVEYLHDTNRCRALFATHYHELSEALEEKLAHLASFHLKVKEWQGEIIFLHEIEQGRAAGSYGVHVAKLAGLPHTVTQRAQTLLTGLEQQAPDLDLNPPETPEQPGFSPQQQSVLGQLQAVDADSLSARDALDLLYDFKRQLTEEK